MLVLPAARPPTPLANALLSEGQHTMVVEYFEHTGGAGGQMQPVEGC